MIKNPISVTIIVAALAITYGCGSNPEDKETRRIDRTRNFTKQVRGAYSSQSGNQIDFKKDKMVEIQFSEQFDVVVSKYDTNRLKASIVMRPGQSGWANDVYISTGIDLSDVGSEVSFTADLKCQYVHSGKIDKVFWLPKPRDDKKLSYEIENLRSKSQDVNFSLHFKELETTSSLPLLSSIENEKVDRIVKQSDELNNELSAFCSNDDFRKIYDKNDYGSPMLPMKSYSKEKIEFLQIDDYQVMKLAPTVPEQVTSEVFEKKK